jgi:hypothetical protein
LCTNSSTGGKATVNVFLDAIALEDIAENCIISIFDEQIEKVRSDEKLCM